MIHSLRKFNLGDMAVCTGAIRTLANSADSSQEIADGLVSYFYENFVEGNSHDFALVRLFLTRPYFCLTDEEKECANKSFPKELSFPTMKCMVLQSSIGLETQWCDIAASEGHRVIPLPSEDLVKQMPMIYQLINDFGLRVSDVLSPPKNFFLGASENDYNIFLVQDAVDSPYIPSQEKFVKAYDIKSALGFGGLLPTGNLFAILLFSKVRIATETATMFRTIALAANLALMRFDKQSTNTRAAKVIDRSREPNEPQSKIVT